MKKLLALVIIAVTVVSCHKKMTPSATVATTVTAPTVPTVPVVVDSAAVNKMNAMNTTMVAAGQQVYVAKCGKCHGLKDPANYTQVRWVGLVNWMAPKAKATDEEKSQVLAYVQHNAKDAEKN